MKSIIYLFAIIVCFQNTLFAQYCTPTYSSGCSLDAIQYFSLKGESGSTIYNNTGSCSISYNDYTSAFSAVTLSIGLSYSGFLRTQDPNNYVSIWIDHNNNNSFESTEQILNNLQIGTTNTLYSIFIPVGFTLGTHRMRVRNIYYGSAPGVPSDPCNLYTYGETEDYSVNITNTPAARFVSSGTPGTCLLSSKTTIDAASNNMNANNVTLLDSSNNFIIGLYPTGNSLGTVSANLYVHNTTTRQAPNGNYYLNRNINLNSSNPPSTTYNSRMYYKTTELNSLIAQPGSGVTSQFDLFTYRNADACSASLNDQYGNNINPTGYGSISGDKFLDFVGITGLGNFYFTGQNLAASCLPPLSPSITLSSSTSGTFSWSNPGSGATSFQWAITNSAIPPVTGTTTSSTSTSFSSLSAGQLYYAHVKTICSSSSSTWISIPFSTIYNEDACHATNLILNAPALCENSTNASSIGDPSIACSAPNNTLWYQFTPSITATYNLRMSIPASGDPLNGWAVWFSASGSCPSSLSLSQIPAGTCFEFGQSGNNDIDDLISPTLTAGQTYYIMIDGFSGDFGNYCIQILPVITGLSCATNTLPANGSTNINPMLATTLMWNAVSGATAYNLYLGETNPPPGPIASLPSNSALSSSLNYNTTYYWYVVPYNTTTSASGCAANVTSFTTSNPTNCTPLYSSGCSTGDSLTFFSLKGESGTAIQNASANTCNANGFSNYTGSIAAVQLARSESYAGFIRSNWTNNYVSIWIDQNDNGYFESSEKILNNLGVGTSKLLYSITIPGTMTLGTHRMRVRMIHYAGSPVPSTHPCNFYELGETEDYMVQITNTPGTRNVATGLLGSCITSSVTTIDAESNNNNLAYIALLDSSNNHVAKLYPSGNSFGRTSVSYYVHNGAVRQQPIGSYYLNRNFHFSVDNQPASPYQLRLLYKQTELNAFISQPGSGVTSQFDLVAKQNFDNCSSSMSASSASILLPTGFGSYNGDKFLDFTNVNSLNGFYITANCLATNSTSSVNACGTYNWNGNTYTNSGFYTITLTNAAGCDSIANLSLTVSPSITLGTATASPSTICLGSQTNLNYDNCGTQIGFDGVYAPFNWIQTTSGNSNGIINSSGAPTSISMTSSNGLSGYGSTIWSITAPCSGNFIFDWNYTTTDGAFFDYPRYSIDGSTPIEIPGYNIFGTNAQIGSSIIPVLAGQVLQLEIYSSDNLYGACDVTISNFSGPASSSSQNISWYDAATGGNYLGSGSNLNYTPTTLGNFNYYAEIQDLSSLCVNQNRVSTNLVQVDNSGCNSTLALDLFLQGYYVGGLTMAPALYNQGMSINLYDTDSILVELRDPITLSTVASAQTILHVNGTATCTFPSINGNYYIVIKHRNSVETWSASPISFGGFTSYYDFRFSNAQAYGNNEILVDLGIWALYSGDLNQDENIDLIDQSILETDISIFASGYLVSDINGDGNVDLLDSPPLETNINNFIYSVHP